MLASLRLPARHAAAAALVGAAAGAAGFLAGPPGYAWAGLALAMALAWASAVDLDRFILPDVITLGLTLAGLALAAGAGSQALLAHAIGAAAGYLALLAVAHGYRRWRGREGLGLGDAKLMAAAGAWLGWAALPSVLLAGSLGGAAFVLAAWRFGGGWSADRPLAFGPFLAAGFWLVWLFGPVAGFPYPTLGRGPA
jgi:leader peptidase (prepilin peptidase)/N-methyltransferase